VQPAAGSTSPGGDGERHHAVIVFADVVGTRGWWPMTSRAHWIAGPPSTEHRRLAAGEPERPHAPGARVPTGHVRTPAPAFPAARDWRSLPARAACSRLAGL